MFALEFQVSESYPYARSVTTCLPASRLKRLRTHWS